MNFIKPVGFAGLNKKLYIWRRLKQVKTYKYRMYPTRSQVGRMENMFSMLRHLYNWNLIERKEAYEKDKTQITYIDQQNKLPALKKERPWFKGVYSLTLQDALRRLDKAYQGFYRRAKAVGWKPSGYPRLKKKGEWSSMSYSQHKDLPGSKIRIPKVGYVKLSFHRNVPKNARVKTLTIKKDGDKWFACFSLEFEIQEEPKRYDRVVGIDAGLNDFIYTSEGESIGLPKFYQQREKHLAKLQRRFCKEKKRTKRWYKLLKAIQRAHFRVKTQRNEFHHKVANWLLSRYDVICIEDLNIKSMQGTNLRGMAKSIANAGWYQFRLILSYKAIEQGKTVIAVPPAYTTQRCSGCGAKNEMSLSQRTYSCGCGRVLARDHNAAINIKNLGIEILAASFIEVA